MRRRRGDVPSSLTGDELWTGEDSLAEKDLVGDDGVSSRLIFGFLHSWSSRLRRFRLGECFIDESLCIREQGLAEDVYDAIERSLSGDVLNVGALSGDFPSGGALDIVVEVRARAHVSVSPTASAMVLHVSHCTCSTQLAKSADE